MPDALPILATLIMIGAILFGELLRHADTCPKD